MHALSKTFAVVLATVILGGSMPSAVRASGTIVIHQADGSIDTYNDVDVRVLSGELFLTSEDGDGTIVVNEAACSYQGKIIICYPKAIALVQDGEANALTVKSGTIYLNYTDDAQPMSFSSAKLPAHSVVVAFTTKAGMFVTLHGRIDQVVKL